MHTAAELQLRHGAVHVTQVLVFERKLEVPQLRQIEGLFVEQVAHDEKHFVQFDVPTILM